MKKTILAFLTLVISISASAQVNGAVSQQFFQLPIIPDSIVSFQNRCDFMVTHYWDFCDLKKAFSSRDKMADAFKMYISFMPYASADVVFKSVDKFLGGISKKPDDMLFIARLAENNIYADTAEFQSEQLYTHFIDGILKSKKLDKNSREYYEKQASVLHNSQEGMMAPSFDITDSQGAKTKFVTDTAQFATLLMFMVPGDSDAELAKTRLNANIKTSQLVKSGMLKIYCIATKNNGERFTSPEGWTSGFAPGIEEIYDVRKSPMFYIINSEGKILKKGNELEPVLNVMQLIRIPRNKTQQTTN
ncbi:MAG: DUF5106 domain-containing protein [Muribaculaceae bacterium]|jgi:hypothetical protein|nr:DUF5106 domain-containing protein [Muribaculaceae bacterium]